MKIQFFVKRISRRAAAFAVALAMLVPSVSFGDLRTDILSNPVEAKADETVITVNDKEYTVPAELSTLSTVNHLHTEDCYVVGAEPHVHDTLDSSIKTSVELADGTYHINLAPTVPDRKFAILNDGEYIIDTISGTAYQKVGGGYSKIGVSTLFGFTNNNTNTTTTDGIIYVNGDQSYVSTSRSSFGIPSGAYQVTNPTVNGIQYPGTYFRANRYSGNANYIQIGEAHSGGWSGSNYSASSTEYCLPWFYLLSKHLPFTFNTDKYDITDKTATMKYVENQSDLEGFIEPASFFFDLNQTFAQQQNKIRQMGPNIFDNRVGVSNNNFVTWRTYSRSSYTYIGGGTYSGYSYSTYPIKDKVTIPTAIVWNDDDTVSITSTSYMVESYSVYNRNGDIPFPSVYSIGSTTTEIPFSEIETIKITDNVVAPLETLTFGNKALFDRSGTFVEGRVTEVKPHVHTAACGPVTVPANSHEHKWITTVPSRHTGGYANDDSPSNGETIFERKCEFCGMVDSQRTIYTNRGKTAWGSVRQYIQYDYKYTINGVTTVYRADTHGWTYNNDRDEYGTPGSWSKYTVYADDGYGHQQTGSESYSSNLPACKNHPSTTTAYLTCTACYGPRHVHNTSCYQTTNLVGSHYWSETTSGDRSSSDPNSFSNSSSTNYVCTDCWKTTYKSSSSTYYFNGNGSSSSYDGRATFSQPCKEQTFVICICPESTANIWRCAKSSGKRYNPDGSEAEPVCDQVVTRIEPFETYQEINAGDIPNTMARVTFLDGHQEYRECAIDVFEPTCYNETQTITISCGIWSNTAKNKAPLTNSDIVVKINGFFSLKVFTANQGMGIPSIGIEPQGRDEFIGKYLAGAITPIYANPKIGYSLDHWSRIFYEDNKAIELTPALLGFDNHADNPEWRMQPQDIYLKAYYRANEYEVTLDFDGGVMYDLEGNPYGSEVRTMTYGQTYGILPEPEREGYEFIGWQNQYTMTTVFSDTVVQTPLNHTLKAMWSKNILNLKIDYDRPYDYYVNPESSAGRLFTLAAGDKYGDGYYLFKPQRIGYKFDGWYFDEDEYNYGLLPEIIPSMLMKKTYDHYGHARWIPNDYKITFKVYGEDESAEDYDNAAVTWTEKTKTVTYDLPYGEFPVPEMEGNTFFGWYRLDRFNGYGERLNKTDICKLQSDITVYAMWKNTPEPEGEVKEITPITVTLDPNGGTPVSTVTFAAIMNEPYGPMLDQTTTRNRHTFKGWYTDPDTGYKRIPADICKEEDDVTFYAHWEHYISYYPNTIDVYGNPLTGHPMGYVEKQTLRNNESLIQVQNNGYVLPMYNFIGWNTKADGTGTWYYTQECQNAEGEFPVENDYADAPESMSLFAMWDGALYIGFDFSGGRYSGDNPVGVGYQIPAEKAANSGSVLDDASRTFIRTSVGRTIPANAVVPVKMSYIFKGYYTGTEGSGEKVYDENGRYCYFPREGALLFDDGDGENRIMLTDGAANTVSVGTTRNSLLVPNTAVPWYRIDKLYAYWEYDYKSVIYPEDIDYTNPYETFSVTGSVGANLHLDVSNPDYNVKDAVPSTEDITIDGEISRETFWYKIKTAGDEDSMTEVSYIVTIPYRTIYEDPVTEELHGFDASELKVAEIPVTVEKYLNYYTVDTINIFEASKLEVYTDGSEDASQVADIEFEETKTLGFSESELKDAYGRPIATKFTDSEGVFEVTGFYDFGRIVATDDEIREGALFAGYSPITRSYSDEFDEQYSKRNINKFLKYYDTDNVIIFYNKTDGRTPLPDSEVDRYLKIVARNIALKHNTKTRSDVITAAGHTILSEKTENNTRFRLNSHLFVGPGGLAYTKTQQNNALTETADRLLAPIRGITLYTEPEDINANHTLRFSVQYESVY